MNAKLGLAAGQVTIDDLRSTVAGQAVSGQGMLDLRGAVPTATGTLALDSLDMDWLARACSAPSVIRAPARLRRRRSQRAA